MCRGHVPHLWLCDVGGICKAFVHECVLYDNYVNVLGFVTVRYGCCTCALCVCVSVYCLSIFSVCEYMSCVCGIVCVMHICSVV